MSQTPTWKARLASVSLAIGVRLLRLLAPVLVPLFAKLRASRGVQRSFWGVTPILTLPLLARADRLLGRQAETGVFVTYHITRNFDWNMSNQQAWVLAHIPHRYSLWCEALFLLALMRFDAFHYFYDRGIMAPAARFGINHRELELIRQHRKQLFTYAYGADVRAREATLALGRWNFCVDCDAPGRYCICSTEELTESMRPVIPIAKAMNAMGDMLTYVPNANHINYWPIDTDRFKPAPPRKREPGSRLVVAHAPNHSHFKGTRYLLQAIEKLQAEGLDIELKRVQGVPNEEVLALFEQADVVVDQLVGGFYGYTALEAMAVGRPVMTYVRSHDLLLPEFPLLNATPDSVEGVLRSIFLGGVDLDALGAAGRAYVEAHQSVAAVSRRLASLYRA